MPFISEAEWLAGRISAIVRNTGGSESTGTKNPESPTIG